MVITLCGSRKVRDDVFAAADQLRNLGFAVLCPPLHKLDVIAKDYEPEGLGLVWKGATFAHFSRIAKADVVFVVNTTSYVGASTTLELGYAAALHKVLVAAQHDTELAREGLFDFVAESDDPAVASQRVADFLGGR
jgi:nucleoside 2-deoxyribosyltransferase